MGIVYYRLSIIHIIIIQSSKFIPNIYLETPLNKNFNRLIENAFIH